MQNLDEIAQSAVEELRHCIDQFEDGWGFNVAMAKDHLVCLLKSQIASAERRARSDAFEKCRTAVSAAFAPMGASSQELWNMFDRWRIAALESAQSPQPEMEGGDAQ